MNFNFDAIPDAPGSLIGLNVVLVVLAFATACTATAFLVSAADDRETANRLSNTGDIAPLKTPRRNIAGVILLFVMLGLGVWAGVGIHQAVTIGEQRAPKINQIVAEQVQQRYGLKINSDQANELIRWYVAGYDPSRGSTQVLLDGQIVEVSLYHVGDDWILARTDDSGSKQISELPTIQ